MYLNKIDLQKKPRKLISAKKDIIVYKVVVDRIVQKILAPEEPFVTMACRMGIKLNPVQKEDIVRRVINDLIKRNWS